MLSVHSYSPSLPHSLGEEDVQEGVAIPVQYVKYQNVQSITVSHTALPYALGSTRCSESSEQPPPLGTSPLAFFERMASLLGAQTTMGKGSSGASNSVLSREVIRIVASLQRFLIWRLHCNLMRTSMYVCVCVCMCVLMN